jgi:hypothetical protein
MLATALPDTEPPHPGAGGRRGSDEPSLLARVPGQAIMSVLLEEQHKIRPRSRLARLLGSSPLAPEALPWYLGVLGEEAVGRLLAKLGSEWVVLHSVPVGERDADIDHVVIGPSGVVTVNTKHHRGQRVWVANRTFMVAGRKEPYIVKAKAEARRAARYLTPRNTSEAAPVSPVVVVVDPKQLTVKQKPTDVTVLQHQQLLRWLRRLPVELTHEEVGRLGAKAELPWTWRKAASHESTTGAANLEAAFARIHREVRGARRIRLAWVVGAYGAVAGSAVVLGPEMLSALVRALLQ